MPENEGYVAGEVEAVPAGEQADSYVLIKKKQKPEDQQNRKGEQNQSQ